MARPMAQLNNTPDGRRSSSGRGFAAALVWAFALASTALPAAAAPDFPTWNNLGEPVTCERQGVTLQAAKKAGVNEYRIVAVFTDKVYYETTAFVNAHPLPYDGIISYDEVTPLPTWDTRLFCDQEGFTISRLNGIWEVTEHNDNLGGYVELGSNPPPVAADFQDLSVLWNLYRDKTQGEIDGGCDCELSEGWESGWQGGSPWIEWQIEHEPGPAPRPRPPSHDPPSGSNDHLSPVVTPPGHGKK